MTSNEENVFIQRQNLKSESTGVIPYFRFESKLMRQFFAELLGTTILLIGVNTSVVQVKLLNQNNTGQGAAFIAAALGPGFSVLMAVLVTGKLSGAHLNPAVSFGLFLNRQLSFVRFVVYSIAQMIGGFLGAALTYFVYIDVIRAYHMSTEAFSLDTAEIFATYPKNFLSTSGAFFDQFIATSLLLVIVLALSDKRNSDIPHGTSAIIIALIVTMFGTVLGYNCGNAMNPARDFSPRLFSYIAGWGSKVFTAGNYFFWIPIVGPMCGSAFGTLLYNLFI